MPIKFAIILCITGLTFLSFKTFNQQNNSIKSVPTGIILDSMNNEVILVFENDLPAYYKSEIFTPVCNTGECLPVNINLYWSLNGEYLRFDQPENEILTKLDHEPFTAHDYKLLDEILKGPDPRMASLGLSHAPSKPSNGNKGIKTDIQEGDYQESNPSPRISANTLKMDKHDMVDGISGATRPEVKTQFVPGALYTTYTLWGLANDTRYLMLDYTKANLYKKYGKHLIAIDSLKCRSGVIEWMASKNDNLNARASVLAQLISTSDSLVQMAGLKNLYYNDYEFTEIQEAIDHLFYGRSTNAIQAFIIQNWTYVYTSPSTLLKLSNNLLSFEHHFPQLISLYENKVLYPKGMGKNMAVAYPKLKEENQLLLNDFFKKRKNYFDKEDIALIKKFK